MRIGFDRYLRFAWCERALEEAARGAELAEARARLGEALAGEIEGERSRTVTVRLLQQIWLAPAPEHHSLWEEAIEAYQRGADTLPLHWGMSMAAYPFFRVVAEAAGRPLRLQDHASAPTVLRRIAETYGERPTARRAAQRVLQTMVDWGALARETEGDYIAEPAMIVGRDMSEWLLSATLWSAEGGSLAFEALASSPALFPFQLARVDKLRAGAALVRQGGGRELAVARRGGQG